MNLLHYTLAFFMSTHSICSALTYDYVPKPEFAEHQNELNVTTFAGHTARLPCTVRNLGGTRVSWIRGRDLQVLSTGRITVVTDRRISVLPGTGGYKRTKRQFPNPQQEQIEPKRAQMINRKYTQDMKRMHYKSGLNLKSSSKPKTQWKTNYASKTLAKLGYTERVREKEKHKKKSRRTKRHPNIHRYYSTDYQESWPVYDYYNHDQDYFNYYDDYDQSAYINQRDTEMTYLPNKQKTLNYSAFRKSSFKDKRKWFREDDSKRVYYNVYEDFSTKATTPKPHKSETKQTRSTKQRSISIFPPSSTSLSGNSKELKSSSLPSNYLDGVWEPEDFALQIKYASVGDAGTYICQINTEPRMSQVIHLSIVDMIAEIVGTSEVFVKAGNPVTLECRVNNATVMPGFIFWYKGKNLVDYAGSRKRIHVMTLPDGSSKLLIKQVVAMDTGNYTCSPSGGEAASVILNVVVDEKRPAAMQPRNIGFSPGSNVLLSIAMIILIIILYQTPDSNCDYVTSQFIKQKYLREALTLEVVNQKHSTNPLTKEAFRGMSNTSHNCRVISLNNQKHATNERTKLYPEINHPYQKQIVKLQAEVTSKTLKALTDQGLYEFNFSLSLIWDKLIHQSLSTSSKDITFASTIIDNVSSRESKYC